jgi:hypothetical protein
MSVSNFVNYSRTRGTAEPRSQRWWYIYTAYAPFDDGRVLVKVGISSMPHQRFVALYCGCPFTIRLCAFTSVGTEKQAHRVESAILKEFSQYKTRGEWLLLPTDELIKKRFAEFCRKEGEKITRKPVKWTRFNEEQIRAVISFKIDHRKDGEWGGEYG